MGEIALEVKAEGIFPFSCVYIRDGNLDFVGIEKESLSDRTAVEQMQLMFGELLTIKVGWIRAHIKGKVGDNSGKIG